MVGNTSENKMTVCSILVENISTGKKCTYIITI